ncbi:hypothetical protein LshimejAT787_0100110 [Lyophyllum shimeji]|uniref:Uncharacterized protein n=1 Tax=Lyophyllum shimeji TaxID=47721 RepID=A0A9P3PCA5_LYOSH|nr:hypothetical protein LshimejAT787_0100110 [Lyophyllum shimeji]
MLSAERLVDKAEPTALNPGTARIMNPESRIPQWMGEALHRASLVTSLHHDPTETALWIVFALFAHMTTS